MQVNVGIWDDHGSRLADWMSFEELVVEWTSEEAFGLVRMEGRDVEKV